MLPLCPRQVSYKTQNFLDKNRDFVVAEHQALMQASSEPFTHLLFPSDPDAVRAAALLGCSMAVVQGRVACHLPLGCRAQKRCMTSEPLGCALKLCVNAFLAQLPQHGALYSLFVSCPLPLRAERETRRAGRQAGRQEHRAGVQVRVGGEPVQAAAGGAHGRAAHHGAALHTVHQAQLLQQVRGVCVSPQWSGCETSGGVALPVSMSCDEKKCALMALNT